ncbi:MAG: hypothetical protein HYW50_04230, partial [Candidatus Diapherotrites archaeon]|nr:hypothetical protein [Candidatus Diapherotrites archaeon]
MSKLIFLVSFVLIFCASVFAQSFGFAAAQKSIEMEKGSETAVLLEFFNNSGNTVTVNVFAREDTEKLFLGPLSKEFALNNGQRTSFSLSIKSDETTPAGKYIVNISSGFGGTGSTVTEQITVTVGSNAVLKIEQADSSAEFCLGEYKEQLQFFVQNLSATSKTVTFFSETDLFFPEFSLDKTTLLPNEQKTQNLTINVNRFSSPQNYSIPVTAKTDSGETISTNFDFELIECTKKKSFDLTLESESISIKKFEKKRIHFSISNNLLEVQEIFFNATSDLPVAPSQFAFTFGPLESQSGFVEIEARKNDEQGIAFVDVFAWSKEGEERKEITVRIAKAHNLRARLLQDALVAQSCSATKTAVFEIELENTGDATETVQISLLNELDDIKAVLSEENFVLKEGEKKTARAVVSPSFGAELGEREILLKIKAKDFDFREEIPLKFIVEGPELLDQLNAIKILSAPEKITASAGEQKTVFFTIENPNSFPATGLSAKVRGVDNSKFSFGTNEIPFLGPHQTTTFNLNLVTAKIIPEKIYELTLEIESKNSVTAFPFSLQLKAEKNNAKTQQNTTKSDFLGLLSLFEPFSVIAFPPTIILIFAVGIILLFL